jgi:hypothetical protein
LKLNFLKFCQDFLSLIFHIFLLFCSKSNKSQ